MACFGTKEGKEQLHAKAVALRRYPGWISLTHTRNAERKRLTKVHRPRVFIRFKRCDPLGSHIAKPDLGDSSVAKIFHGDVTALYTWGHACERASLLSPVGRTKT